MRRGAPLSGRNSPWLAFADLFEGLPQLVVVAQPAAHLAPGEDTNDDVPVLPLLLEPHLGALSSGFGLPDTMQQLPLFPALSVK